MDLEVFSPKNHLQFPIGDNSETHFPWHFSSDPRLGLTRFLPLSSGGEKVVATVRARKVPEMAERRGDLDMVKQPVLVGGDWTMNF